MTSPWTRRAAARAGSIVLATWLLATTSFGAEPIRVLVVMPGESGKLARQVTQFEDALRRSRGRVVRAASLADADAVVQFTAYRRVISDKGEPQDRWYGHYVLLNAPSQGAGSVGGATRFGLIVIGREDWQVEPVVELLGVTLGRALGLVSHAQPDEPL
jgi:hypothetical protein